MAEETTDNTNDVPPPKIKLNGDAAQTGADAAQPKEPKIGAVPPRVQSQVPPHKEQTARIDFSSARLPSPTARLKIGKPGDAKKSTSKIDLPPGVKDTVPHNIEDLSKRSTIRITTPIDISPIAPADQQEAVKSSTVKIDDAAMQPMSDDQKEEAIKKSTVRIETPAEIQPMSAADKSELAKKTTARVIIDEERAKGDTTRIEPAVSEPSDAAKKRTARIDLGEVLDEEEDIFKRRTALIDSSKFAGATDAPGAPRTIRIKRPDTPPTTQMPPPEPEAEEEVVVPVSQAEAARKSETARIDLPPEVAEQPPTRKKTIRIKRPGASSTGGKPLVITRTPVDSGVGMSAKPKIVEEDSPAFAWIALAAVLVVAVLIYVLASQTGTIDQLLPARFPYAGSL
jgi:hypothetical protein